MHRPSTVLKQSHGIRTLLGFSALPLMSGYQLKNSFQEYHVAHLLQSLFIVIYNLSQETICQTNKKRVQISEHQCMYQPVTEITSQRKVY